jgi:hypothetical protein
MTYDELIMRRGTPAKKSRARRCIRQKGLHLLVEGEIEEQGARLGEHQGEDRQRAVGGPDAHVPEGAPVDLRLLTGLDLDTQIDPTLAWGPDVGDIVAQLREAQVQPLNPAEEWDPPPPPRKIPRVPALAMIGTQRFSTVASTQVAPPIRTKDATRHRAAAGGQATCKAIAAPWGTRVQRRSWYCATEERSAIEMIADPGSRSRNT